MDCDDDMSGLQIEDLGEYFLQTDINDNWKGFSLGYTDDGQDQQEARTPGSENSSFFAANGGNSMPYLMSPLLSMTSEMIPNGVELEVGSGIDDLSKTDLSTLFQTEEAPTSAKSDGAIRNRTLEDALELADFTLDPQKITGALTMPNLNASKKKMTLHDRSVKPAGLQLESLQCQHILSSDDDDMKSLERRGPPKRDHDFSAVSCYPSICPTIASKSSISAPLLTPEDDRGSRKKSREKMRRQEVNVKFEELVDLLGLSSRVRKSAILREAVSTIKALKRERDELRRDRDRLQQDARKLATCLQYSHLGSVAAVNAAAASQQPNQQYPHRNPLAEHLNQQQVQHTAADASGLEAVHTHPHNIPCNLGTNCFPLRSAFSTISSQYLGPQFPSASSVSGQVAIAPKSLKPTPSYSHHPHHRNEVN